MIRSEDSKVKNFRTKLKRELLKQMKESYGNNHSFELEQIIHHQIKKLKMIELTKVKKIQSNIEAQIKNKLKLCKRRKFSLSKKRESKKQNKLDNWLRESSPGKIHQSVPKSNMNLYSNQGHEDYNEFINIQTPDETTDYIGSGSGEMKNSSRRHPPTQKESFIDTLTEDDQSQMISNLSKLTKKNVINRLSQSKDVFSIERKKKAITVSRETRVKQFGADKKNKTNR
jgi:hypothetical protein